MHKFRVLLIGSALLMAACGGGAVLSTTAKDQPASLAGSIQVRSGANAGSGMDNADVNHVNPSIKKGTGIWRPLVPTQPQTATPNGASGGSISPDRCGISFGSGGGANNRFIPQAGGKRPPLPMCAAQ